MKYIGKEPILCRPCAEIYDDHKCRCELLNTRYHFCDKCKERITPKGRYKMIDGEIWCRPCIKKSYKSLKERNAISYAELHEIQRNTAQ